MNIGIVGLTSSGKSTLFSAFTGTEAKPGKDKFNIGIVNVPDNRLEEMSKMYKPKKTVYTNVSFIDTIPIDTPVKQEKIMIFDTLKTAESIVFVIGAYKHSSKEDVAKEIGKLRLDMIISDLDLVVKRSERLQKEMRSTQEKTLKEKEIALLEKLQPVLENERFLYGMEFDKQEQAIMTQFNLLTMKPVCYVINHSESQDRETVAEMVKSAEETLRSTDDKSQVMSINAQLESEISMMSPEDIQNFLKEYGIKELGRDRVIKTAYSLLNLITFFTVGEDECRSWKIRREIRRSKLQVQYIRTLQGDL